MWDPRSTKQFRWTENFRTDHPGWITLYYKGWDSDSLEMFVSVMHKNRTFFYAFRCWSVHCPFMTRKMTASPREDSLPNFSQIDFFSAVSMKWCSVEGYCYYVSHFSILVISCCSNSPSPAEFPEDSVQFLHERDHEVQRVETNSAVQGILRSKDTIKSITLPQWSVYYSFLNITKFVFL